MRASGAGGRARPLLCAAGCGLRAAPGRAWSHARAGCSAAVAGGAWRPVALSLSSNPRVDSVAGLARAHTLRCLRVLGLGGCRVGDDGACALAEALGGAAAGGGEGAGEGEGWLEELDLASNGIGRRGAAALASVCRALRLLRLFGNGFGDAGALAFAGAGVLAPGGGGGGGDGGMHNRMGGGGGAGTRLRALDLGGNAITDHGARAVVEAAVAGRGGGCGTPLTIGTRALGPVCVCVCVWGGGVSA